MSDLQAKLAAAAAGKASDAIADKAIPNPRDELPADNEIVRKGYRAVGHKYGLQTTNRIIRPDVFGFYVPENDEEIAFLDSKVAEGFLTKID